MGGRVISAKSYATKIPIKRPFKFKRWGSLGKLVETVDGSSFNKLNVDMTGNPVDQPKGFENSFYKNVSDFEKGLKDRNGFANNSIFYPAINYKDLSSYEKSQWKMDRMCG